MICHHKKIAAQRALLLAECNIQRRLLAAELTQIKNPWDTLTSGDTFIPFFKHIPTWLLCVLISAFVFMPKQSLHIAQSGIKKILLLTELWRVLKPKKRS